MKKNMAQAVARKKAQTEERYKIHDALVVEALQRLGGKWQGRVMLFRYHLSESLREVQIKDAIKRLVDAGKVRVVGEKNSHKGNLYEVTE